MITSHETEIDYMNFFNALKTILKLEDQYLDPQWITVDACKASANPIKKNFPNCTLFMCYFHLKYNIRKKKAMVGRYYKRILNHITSLHNSKSNLEFQEKFKLIREK